MLKNFINPTLELIHQHGSCRRYKTDPLPTSVIETIVGAGQRASTSSNLQTYSVIAVTDASKREQLFKLCGQQQHIVEAPLFLAFCADLARMERICQLRGYTQVADQTENFLIAALDAGIVAQNTALAAQSLGLGVCYIGAIRNNPREVIDLLGLPKLVFPITGMTVGHPAKEPRLRPRLPLREILHLENYHAPIDEALREYDQDMIDTGIYKNRQVPIPGKSEEMEEYGWMEHSARRSTQVLRPFLREVLEEQGFALK
jgi:FMN reductase (NADPH)